MRVTWGAPLHLVVAALLACESVPESVREQVKGVVSAPRLLPRGRYESIRRTPPVVLDCCWSGIRPGITPQTWISHSSYSSNANTHAPPHAEGLTPLFTESVQIPCLVTPTCSGFHSSLPPLLYIPATTFHSPPPPLCCGNLHLWPPQQPPAPRLSAVARLE